ncbi:MAG: SixA phosphatase family protein [Acidimicrobiales bacterium]
MNILYVLRHAKSNGDDSGMTDHDRPLAPRGRRATTRLADHVRRSRIQPDLVLCSSARRACETLERIHAALGAKHVVVEKKLYGASAAELLVRLRRVEDDVRSVLVVGHNPGLQDLVVTIAGDGDDDALLRVRRTFPTGALATLSFPAQGWNRLGPRSAHLETLVVPRDLE